MERKYNITMNVPLGHRKGTLYFTEDEENHITGTLNIFEHDTSVTGELKPNGDITFCGNIKTLIRTFSYQAEGKITGKSISLKVIGERNKFTILGEEVKQ